MARSHGQLLASIWSDPDFVARSSGAQRAYMLLLSQPKLTLVGLLDYLPGRWGRLAADTTLDSIEADIAELEASRFVVVDRHTDELLIRTLVKHDMSHVLTNRNLLRGLWRSWDAIESRQLRLAAVREIPDAVWASEKCQPHPDALEMRRSQPSEPAVQTDRSDQPSEPSEATDRQNPRAPALHPPPSTLHPPPETRSADHQQPGNSRGPRPAEAAAGDNRGRLSDPERQQRLDQAIDLLVDRELERNPTRGPNPGRHADAVRLGKRKDHRQAGHQALIDDPSLTPDQLAEILEPTPTPGSTSTGERIDRTYDEQQRALLARAEAGTTQTRQLAEQEPDPDLNKRGLGDARAAMRRRPGPGDTP